RRLAASSSSCRPTSTSRSPTRTSSVCFLSRGAEVAALLVNGQRGGCAPSPDHAESRSPWPLWRATRSGLALRRSSPEDTGLGREHTPRTALSARQRPESAPRPIDGGGLNAGGVLHHGLRRVGPGASPQNPIFLGGFPQGQGGGSSGRARGAPGGGFCGVRGRHPA